MKFDFEGRVAEKKTVIAIANKTLKSCVRKEIESLTPCFKQGPQTEGVAPHKVAMYFRFSLFQTGSGFQALSGTVQLRKRSRTTNDPQIEPQMIPDNK